MVDRIKNDRRLNNMKYCRKCGTKMNDDAVFCSKCGTKVVNVSDISENPVDTRNTPESAAKKSGCSIKIFGLIFIGFVILCVVVGSCISNGNKKDKNTTKNSSPSTSSGTESSASVTEGISSNESTPKQYTAEEFIDKYNELAMDTDDKVDTINLSDAKKEKDDDGTLYYMINVNLQKSIFLTLDGNDYSGKISSVCLISVIPDGDDSVYPYEVANTISVFVNNISFSDACSVCEKAMKNQEYTDSSIPGIVLRNRIGTGETNNYDNWIVELTDSDSTAVQSDSNADESSQASETSPENEISDNDYSSEMEQLEQERINTLNELKTSADKMLHESYNKNDYEAVQQKEIESIINKYMEQINNANVANDVNKLYAAAINEINNIKTKKQIEEDKASSIENPGETIYSEKIFFYNGVTYYTPDFSGKSYSGYFDFSDLGETYKALPHPERYSARRTIDIDSFLIVDGVVYFTDQEPGSVSPLPSRLFRMNLDGSDYMLIAENVDVKFCYKNGSVYFVSCYSPDSTYAYDSSTAKISSADENISLDSANTIFDGQSRVEFHGGIYYKEQNTYYREDKSTGKIQVIGYNYGGGQQ